MTGTVSKVIRLLRAVSRTDSATSPPASLEKMLEELPPGQQAISTIPMKKTGGSRKASASPAARIGSRTICPNRAMTTALGRLKTRRKSSIFSVNPRSNIRTVRIGSTISSVFISAAKIVIHRTTGKNPVASVDQREVQHGAVFTAEPECLVGDLDIGVFRPHAGLVGMDGVFREVGGFDVEAEGVSGTDGPNDGQRHDFNADFLPTAIGLTIAEKVVPVAEGGDGCTHVIGFSIGHHFTEREGESGIVDSRADRQDNLDVPRDGQVVGQRLADETEHIVPVAGFRLELASAALLRSEEGLTADRVDRVIRVIDISHVPATDLVVREG